MIDRRNFLSTSMAVGATSAFSLMASNATAATVDPADALKGPYLDLTTPRGNMLALARITSNLELGEQRYGWYSGYVTGVRPGEKVRDLVGFEGFGVSRLLPREDGSFAKVLREVGIYFDLETGEPLEEWVNPYSGETVRPVHVANDPFNTVIREFVPPPPNYGGLNPETREPKPLQLPWKLRAGKLEMERHIHLYYKNALQPDKWPRESAGEMVQVSEFFAHFFDPADIQNPELTVVPFHGTWNRITPWLPWMLMGQAEGHCTYFCSMGTTNHPSEVLHPSILAYVEENYPKYFEAPTEWEEPSLSSIERYALEQQPAPVKN